MNRSSREMAGETEPQRLNSIQRTKIHVLDRARRGNHWVVRRRKRTTTTSVTAMKGDIFQENIFREIGGGRGY